MALWQRALDHYKLYSIVRIPSTASTVRVCVNSIRALALFLAETFFLVLADQLLTQAAVTKPVHRAITVVRSELAQAYVDNDQLKEAIE